MVQDLSLALNTDNIEACFIFPDISFHKLGPELGRYIVGTKMCSMNVSIS